MKFCTNCGAQIEETAKFCQSCGHAVSSVPAATEETQPPVVEETPVEQQSSVNEGPVAAPAEQPTDIKAKAAEGVNKTKLFVKEKAQPFLKNKALPFARKHFKLIIAAVAVIVAIVVAVSIYNSTHCTYGSCNNASVDGSDYCYTRKCNLCSSAKKYNSNYCYYHDLIQNGTSSSSGSSFGSSTSSAYSDLKFTNVKVTHNSLYTVVTGTVTNKGTRNYKFVTVKGAFKSSSGTVLDTDSTYAVGSEGLAPGESKTFRMSVEKNYSIKKCDISITGYK